MSKGPKVDWKPIREAERTGLVYWLSGWQNCEPGTKRWVCSGYWSHAEEAFVDEDAEPREPTHFAEKYLPEPPTE